MILRQKAAPRAVSTSYHSGNASFPVVTPERSGSWGRHYAGLKKKAVSIKVTVTAEALYAPRRYYFRIITWNFTRFIGSMLFQ